MEGYSRPAKLADLRMLVDALNVQGENYPVGFLSCMDVT